MEPTTTLATTLAETLEKLQTAYREHQFTAAERPILRAMAAVSRLQSELAQNDSLGFQADPVEYCSAI